MPQVGFKNSYISRPILLPLKVGLSRPSPRTPGMLAPGTCSLPGLPGVLLLLASTLSPGRLQVGSRKLHKPYEALLLKPYTAL